MISATRALTDAPRAISARSCAASAIGSPSAVRRSHCIEALQQMVDRLGLELVRDRVGDQPRGAPSDLLAYHQAVLAQRRARRGEVDDALDQSCQRRQLDRALDLDDFRLPAG